MHPEVEQKDSKLPKLNSAASRFVTAPSGLNVNKATPYDMIYILKGMFLASRSRSVIEAFGAI